MTRMDLAANAYARTARTGLSGRQLEAAVLAQCAAEIRGLTALASPQLPAIVEALDRNRRLWAVFVAAANHADSGLPQAEKDSLLDLARFVFDRTWELLGAWDSRKAMALVEINKRLAARAPSQG